jgi:hypothetical protein
MKKETNAKSALAIRHGFLSFIHAFDQLTRIMPSEASKRTPLLRLRIFDEIAKLEQLTGPLGVPEWTSLKLVRALIHERMLAVDGIKPCWRRGGTLNGSFNPYIQQFWWQVERCGMFFRNAEVYRGCGLEISARLNDPKNDLTDSERNEVKVFPFIDNVIRETMNDLEPPIVPGSGGVQRREGNANASYITYERPGYESSQDPLWIWVINHKTIPASID